MTTIEQLPQSTPAAVLKSPKSLQIEEVPMWHLDSYKDGDMVMLRVALCGVCGSDFRYYLGENPWSQNVLGRFIPNAPNIVLGHEYAGTVVAVLSKQNEHLLGKRVAPVCSKVCGSCADCRAGRTRLCENTVHMGHGQGWGNVGYFPGAYARYAPAWGASCYEISNALSFEEAAMMDILAVCVHVCDQAQIQHGRPILTIGSGPVGNGIAQTALAMGASHAVLLDRSAAAIEIANKQGIGTAIDTTHLSEEQTLQALQKLAPEGFGSVFDSVGSRQTLQLGIKALGKAGTLVNLSIHDAEIPLNFLKLGSERRIVTSCNFEVGDYTKALAWLVAGRLKVKDWLTKTTLHDLPQRFKAITDNPDEKGVFKLVVDPWA